MKLIAKALTFIRPYRKRVFLGQGLMLIGALCGLLVPAMVRPLLDSALSEGVAWEFWRSLIIMAALAAGGGGLGFFTGRILGTVSERITADLRSWLFLSLQQKSLTYHHRHQTGESVSGMTNDIGLFQQALTSGLSYLIRTGVSIVAATALMLTMNPLLTGVFFVTLPIMLLIVKKAGSRTRVISRRVQQGLAGITSLLQQGLGGISVIQGYNLEKEASEIFLGANRRLLSSSLQQVRVRTLAGFLMELATMSQLMLVLGLGGWQVFTGQLTVGTLVSFALYAQMMAGPLMSLSGLTMDVQKSLAAMERILGILDDESVISRPRHPQAPSRDTTLVFQEVRFAYPGSAEAAVDGVSFTIPPGRTAAFVGESGVGKSTLFRLIPRFYDPGEGAISLGGIDIRRMDPAVLRDRMAIVPQETFLFSMSVADNIACGRPPATRAEIIEAARRANAHDFIMELEEGYDTQVGERGFRLSGGQRQRIAIARAFLKNPDILLLDEATSALDNHTEALVQQAVGRLMAGRTTLIIAHRLRTVRDADVIYLMEGGRIQACGAHDELMAGCDAYRRLQQGALSESRADAG